jgi:hypothetical protein
MQFACVSRAPELLERAAWKAEQGRKNREEVRRNARKPLNGAKSLRLKYYKSPAR